jgi:hypothetical protein
LLQDLIGLCEAKHFIDAAHRLELEKMLATGDSQKLLMVAQELSDRFTRPHFVGEIARIFKNPSAKPQAVHRELPKIPFRLVLTTNYDKLVENAYAAAMAVVPPIFTHVNPGGIADGLSNDEFCIVKAHGTVDDAENIIITEKDYRSIIFRASGYRAVLSAIFTTMSVLFVGVSLEDPEVRLLLSYLHEAFHGSGANHYVLVSEDRFSTTIASRWQKDFKVECIRYHPTSGHPEVLKFLRLLPHV